MEEKNMKKKVVSLFLVAGMIASLAACGSQSSSSTTADNTSAGDEAGTETESEASGDKVSLDVIISQYGKNTQEWWQQFEEDFESENPDIDLNIDIVSWNDIYTVVNTRVSTGEAPDILNIDVFADYVADDLLLPVDDYMSEETLAKIYPSFLEQSVVDGTTYAVPILASARALYYNEDILNEVGVEVPTTWDELEDVCAKIKDYYGDDVYPWGIDMTTDEGQAAFAYYTWNNGGGFVDEDGNWALNSTANVEAIQFAMDLINDGYTNEDPANETRYDLQDLFGAGKVAMMIGPNNIPTYLSDGGYEVNYGVASIPSNTGESFNMGVMDRLMAFDNDDSDEKLDAVTKFFDFFYDDERYADYMVFEGFLPATSTGAVTLAAQDETYAAWIDILANCQFYPASKTEWADVKQGVINVEQSALLGEDIQTNLDALQDEITAEEE
jgi:multiple sugar transport system substrate-binding protein